MWCYGSTTNEFCDTLSTAGLINLKSLVVVKSFPDFVATLPFEFQFLLSLPALRTLVADDQLLGNDSLCYLGPQVCCVALAANAVPCISLVAAILSRKTQISFQLVAWDVSLRDQTLLQVRVIILQERFLLMLPCHTAHRCNKQSCPNRTCAGLRLLDFTTARFTYEGLYGCSNGLNVATDSCLCNTDTCPADVHNLK